MALTDNLRAYYKAEDTADSSGNGYTLTNNGTMPYNAAKIGNGFDGGTTNTTKWMNVNSNLGFTSQLQAWSISMWVSISTAPGSGVYYMLATRFSGTGFTAGTSGTFRIYYNNNAGTKRIYIQNDMGGTAIYNVDLGTGTFHHIVFTFDGTNTAGSGIIYVNGSNVATGNLYGTVDYTAFTTVLAIGSERNGSASWICGIVDEVGVWDKMLSSSEVTSLYNGGAGFQYPFTAAGPANLKSLSGNLKANIKSINGNPIANVKSLNSNV